MATDTSLAVAVVHTKARQIWLKQGLNKRKGRRGKQRKGNVVSPSDCQISDEEEEEEQDWEGRCFIVLAWELVQKPLTLLTLFCITSNNVVS